MRSSQMSTCARQRQATSRKGPKAAHMFAPSQWHNLGQNARVRQELSAIKENLNGECDQAELNDLFDRFLKISDRVLLSL